ncbi:MAG: glycosyltransferase family 39 protein [Candidatus Colwellbacteria bacterium]|nr:glycosyltransferase family 39 protein [Candidatus Colwellbacteria bacterium]
MKKEYWLLIFIIIIAAFLRLVNLPAAPPGLYPDEAMNGNNTLEALATRDWKVFYPENNGREGLFINIQSLSIALFGNEPWALRLPSALFGILTVLGVYFLTRELFRESKHRSTIALLAAFLLATSFWHINFSRIGFRAIMAPAFLTWGIYLTLLVLNKIRETSGKIKFRRLLLLSLTAGAVYSLGLHSYIAYRATPLLLLIILIAYLLKSKDTLVRKKILVSCLLFLVSAIIVFLPLGIYFLENPADFFGRTTQVSVFASEEPLKNLALNTVKTLGMFNFAGDYNWRHNLSGQPQLFWPVGIMFLIGFLISLKYLMRDTKYQILIVWFIVAALPVVISNEGMPHALRAILMIPPVFILSAIGGIWIYQFLLEKLKNPQLIKIGVTLLLITFAAEAYYTYFIRWAKNENTAGAFAANYVEIGRELNSLPVDQPKYVIVNAAGFDVRGLPMPTQTVMFLTDTFTPEKQARKNIHYIIPGDVEKTQIPKSAYVTSID